MKKSTTVSAKQKINFIAKNLQFDQILNYLNPRITA